MNVFLEACYSSKTCASVGLLDLISVQQVNNLVHMTKGKNVQAWIVQCSTHSKLNAAHLKELKSLNGTYLCSYVGI